MSNDEICDEIIEKLEKKRDKVLVAMQPFIKDGGLISIFNPENNRQYGLLMAIKIVEKMKSKFRKTK